VVERAVGHRGRHVAQLELAKAQRPEAHLAGGQGQAAGAHHPADPVGRIGGELRPRPQAHAIGPGVELAALQHLVDQAVDEELVVLAGEGGDLLGRRARRERQ
jgi:hypothetical protein